jgi:protein involved in ribonucleotide reduction
LLVDCNIVVGNKNLGDHFFSDVERHSEHIGVEWNSHFRFLQQPFDVKKVLQGLEVGFIWIFISFVFLVLRFLDVRLVEH